MAGGPVKAEKRFKVVKKKKEVKTAAAANIDLGDAWTGGSSQSIYATSSTWGSNHAPSKAATKTADTSYTRSDGLPEPDRDVCFIESSSPASSFQSRNGQDKQSSSDGMHSDSLGVTTAPARQLRKSRSGLSLSERLGMDDIKEVSEAEPMPSFNRGDNFAAKTGKQSKPPHLQLVNQAQDPAISHLSSPVAQAPLSALHSPPETPLKHIGRGKSSDLPSTPGREQAVYDATLRHMGSNRVGGLLLESEEDSPVFPEELQTPKRDNIALSAMRNSSSSSQTNGSQSQIDAMLAKLKLARSGPVVGTQESRWAVKEPEAAASKADEAVDVQARPMKTSMPPAVVEDLVSRKAVVPQAATPTIPTAPRALRKQAVARGSSPQAKSLLERMTTAAEGENPALVKGKKDRKRGGKVANVLPEPSSANSRDKVRDKQQNKKGVKTVSAAAPKPSESPVSVPKQQEERLSPSDSQATNGPLLAPLIHSASTASISTDHTAETSNIGNDTWGTVNWADDDDDLPDLPEEWMRAASLATSDGVKVDDSSSSTLVPPAAVETRPNNHLNANAQRGGRRGGKSRGRDNRQDALPSRGIKIAGSAAQAASREAAKAPKELFPLHKQESETRSGSNIPPREQRLHGRPRLIQSNRDTFGRLTKGALGVSTAASSSAAGSGQAPARK